MELNGLTHNLCNTPDQILLNQSKYRAKYTYPSPEKVLNLMLFYSGRDHTIHNCLRFIMPRRGNQKQTQLTFI